MSVPSRLASPTRPCPGLRRLRLALTLAAPVLACLIAGAARAESQLPTGFGEFKVGQTWHDDHAPAGVRSLDDVSSNWDRLVRACGYRSLLVPTNKGQLLITVNDHVITELSYVTPIKPGSNLLAVADLVIQTYGQPDRATMRDDLGKVTIDRDHVNYISLEYHNPRPVEFDVTGRALWQYRIDVHLAESAWHVNKNLRCARDREREAKAPPPAEAAGSAQPAAPAATTTTQ